jgi:hypothetical protein
MSKVRAIVLGCALSIGWLGPVRPFALELPAALAATDQEKAGARALAEQAIDAFNKGQFGQAVDLLQRAETLVHSPGHWLYTGRAYVKLGKLVLAQEAFLKAEREPLTDSSPDAFRAAVADASAELEVLRPRIAKVTVDLVGVERSAATVTVDGHAVPSALLGVQMPVDPGERKFQATAPGMLPANQSLIIAEGATSQVTLTLQPTAQAAPTAVPEVVPTQPQAAHESSPNSLFLYGGIGAAVLGAGAIVGGYLNYQVGNDRKAGADSIFQACNPRGTCETSGDSAVIDDLDSRAEGRWYTGVGLMALGGLLVAGGTTLMVLSFQDSQGEAALTVKPWATANGMGVNGTF